MSCLAKSVFILYIENHVLLPEPTGNNRISNIPQSDMCGIFCLENTACKGYFYNEDRTCLLTDSLHFFEDRLHSAPGTNYYMLGAPPCGKPPTIDGMEMDEITDGGSKVKYKCPDAKQHLFDGTDYATCGSDKRWIAPTGTCRIPESCEEVYECNPNHNPQLYMAFKPEFFATEKINVYCNNVSDGIVRTYLFISGSSETPDKTRGSDVPCGPLTDGGVPEPGKTMYQYLHIEFKSDHVLAYPETLNSFTISYTEGDTRRPPSVCYGCSGLYGYSCSKQGIAYIDLKETYLMFSPETKWVKTSTAGEIQATPGTPYLREVKCDGDPDNCGIAKLTPTVLKLLPDSTNAHFNGARPEPSCNDS